jgi:hypothetical protein
MTSVKYFCPRCGYSVNKKSNFINHLNRKNICKSVHSDISVYEIIYKYSFNINKLSNRDKSKEVFRCNFCNNKYSTKYNLDRHTLNCYKNTERTEDDLFKRELSQLKATISSKKWKLKHNK